MTSKLPSLLLKLPNTHTYCTCPHMQSLGWIHLQNCTAICVCCKWSTLGFRLWLSLISFINVNIDAFVPVVNYLSNYIETSRYIRSSSMPAIAISITPVAIWAPRPHGHILKIFGPWRRSRRLYGNPAVGDWFTRGEMLGKRNIAPKGDCRFWYVLLQVVSAECKYFNPYEVIASTSVNYFFSSEGVCLPTHETSCASNFFICGWNAVVLPLKRNLFVRPLS